MNLQISIIEPTQISINEPKILINELKNLY